MAFAASSGGTRIYYDVLGADGPHVVLIQGLGLSSTFWFDLPRRLTVEGASPCRVVVVDNRGVGRSDRPWGPYRMGQLADDVAAVLDAAGVARAFVVGISLGGMIAQHVALRHPGRVAGLGLLATTPGLPYGVIPPAATLWALLRLDNVTTELSDQLHMVSRINVLKYRALGRLYQGVGVMTILLTLGLLTVIAGRGL